MSANTYVTKRLWRLGRQVLAGIAGAVVSTTGLTSAALAAQQLAGFELVPGLGSIDLIAAPAASQQLSRSGSPDGAAAADPALKDGLLPGASTFFGYDLALVGGGATSAWVQMQPSIAEGDRSMLTYEARRVADATQCRGLWVSGETVVAPRGFDAPASDLFLMGPGDDGHAHAHLCIRVSLKQEAISAQTGSVVWKFTATNK